MSAEEEADNIDARARAAARFAATRHAQGDWSAVPEGDRPALEAMSGFWRDLDAATDDPALQSLRNEALARFQEAGQASRSRRIWVWGGGAVAASVAAIIALVAVPVFQPAERTPSVTRVARLLANGRGMPRTFPLKDGSRITMDTETAIRLSERDGSRPDITVDHGRVLFDVVHNNARPFKVMSGEITITDIGTRFEVSLRPGDQSVALFDGEIQVGVKGRDRLRLTPGSRMTRQNGDWQITKIEGTRQPQWQSGLISADNEPVAEVVSEFNRYLVRPLKIRNMNGQDIRVSGVFRIDDPQGFLNAVAAMGNKDLVVQE